MENEGHEPDIPVSVRFDRDPPPGVIPEVLHYLLGLPEEVRVGLGNFMLDSTVDGFDGSPETSARLWRETLQRRLEEAENRPERMLSSDEVFARIERRLAQMRRTPWPEHLHGFHCLEYFRDGWAERGYYDEPSHFWLVRPLHDLTDEQRVSFLAIGGPGVDGIQFCFRHGKRGVWAFYPMTRDFKFMAASIAELVEGWTSGKLAV